MVDEEVGHPPSPGSDRSPGWYPFQGKVNQQAYWDGVDWTGRRVWSGTAWVEVPAGAGFPASAPGSHHRRRWMILTAGVVAGGVLAVVLALATTGSTHRSNSTSPATTATAAPAAASSTTTSSVPLPQVPQAAALAACNADASSLEVALTTYQAQQGEFPTPPAPWSAATYGSNFSPLTSASGGGPYLREPPSATSYVIEYDSSGHVWIAPPGSYGDAYDPGQAFDGNPDVCLAAIG